MTKNISKLKEIQEFKAKVEAQKQADLSKYENNTNKIQEKLIGENRQKLTWVDNQVSKFLNTNPPDITGLCDGSGWTFPQGETSLLIAQGGTGKSYLLLGLMLAFATGIEYCGFKPKRKYKVLGLFGEDSEAVLHNRITNIITALGLKNEQFIKELDKNFNALSVIDMRLVEFGDHQNPLYTENYSLLRDFLAKEKAKGEPIEVLVLDPLIRFYGLNENENGHASYFFSLLGLNNKEFNLSTIVSHHVPKAASKGFTALSISDIEQISPRGAGAFLDNCRYTLAMMKVNRKEAKTYGIREEDYKNYVAIKPIKNNYTGEIASPSFLRKSFQGVLMASNPQKDLNLIIEDELLSCLVDYYKNDSIAVTTETPRGKVKTDSVELPPKDERPNLCLKDLKQNANPSEKIRKVVDIIHKRLKNAGIKNIQNEIGLRLTALETRGQIIKSRGLERNKIEIILK